MQLATKDLVKIEFRFPAIEKYVDKTMGYVFVAFITDFDDKFSANWEEETVYGRMDPLQNYRNTSRTISCSFDAPAESGYDALENMIMIKSIQRMLYPLYKKVNQEWIISSAPLCGIKIPTLVEEMSSIDDFLYGCLESFSFKPDMAQGCFDTADGSQLAIESAQEIMDSMDKWATLVGMARQIGINSLRILPKLYKCSFNLKVLHKNPLGWQYGGQNEIRYRTPGAAVGAGRSNNSVGRTFKTKR